MQKRKQTDTVDAFRQFCRERQLKITPQRVAIFKELFRLDTHPTANAVYQIVKKDYPNISFDTVNRTLLTFAQAGIVDVVEIFGGAKRFDPNIAYHHHMHCTRCGQVFDFYNRAYDNLEIPQAVHEQFSVTSKRVVLKGICTACRQREI
jgi:Fur family peroxide stress response transcriptional regulator